jgi:hypothetical protein
MLAHQGAENRIKRLPLKRESAFQISTNQRHARKISPRNPEHRKRKVQAHRSAVRSRYRVRMAAGSATCIKDALVRLGRKEVQSVSPIERHQRVRRGVIGRRPKVIPLAYHRPFDSLFHIE